MRDISQLYISRYAYDHHDEKFYPATYYDPDLKKKKNMKRIIPVQIRTFSPTYIRLKDWMVAL